MKEPITARVGGVRVGMGNFEWSGIGRRKVFLEEGGDWGFWGWVGEGGGEIWAEREPFELG